MVLTAIAEEFFLSLNTAISPSPENMVEAHSVLAVTPNGPLFDPVGSDNVGSFIKNDVSALVAKILTEGGIDAKCSRFVIAILASLRVTSVIAKSILITDIVALSVVIALDVGVCSVKMFRKCGIVVKSGEISVTGSFGRSGETLTETLS